MITYKHLLCSLGLLSFALLTFSCTTKAKKETLTVDKATVEKAPPYFTGYLNGQTTPYTTETPIALSDINKLQASVWQAWVNANNSFSEQKLPQLDKLANAKSGSWQLPSNLEPNATMPFYWGYKGDSIPQEGYPLFLYLHGSGPKAQEWKAGLFICNGFDDAPSAYFIPQIPNEGEYYRWWQKSKQFAWERLLRQAFVSGKFNPNRIYCFGISEGGYGSQRLASFYADYLAAAGPMAGGEPLKNAPAENCRNIAFSLRTGADDAGFYRNKLTQYTKDEFARLQSLYPNNYTNKIELIPGYQHAIDYKPTTPWLKQYVRNPYPKSFNWENFEMDGLYRKGFYNLAVVERSNDNEESRTYYEMNINDNKIDLKADIVTYKCIETDPHWGIQLKFEKSYQPATKGKVIIYLNDQLVDLNREVILTVNGKEMFRGIVKPELRHLINSCATFFDSERLYPAAIEVEISK